MVMNVDAARWDHGMKLQAIANLEARATTSTGGQPKRFAANVAKRICGRGGSAISSDNIT
jgi:hypothetical protein